MCCANLINLRKINRYILPENTAIRCLVGVNPAAFHIHAQTESGLFTVLCVSLNNAAKSAAWDPAIIINLHISLNPCMYVGVCSD